MTVRLVYGLLLLHALVHYEHAFPSGAPASRCNDMIPSHPGSPLETQPPYSLTVDATEYVADQEVTVTVSQTEASNDFKGFFIQARRVLDEVIVGTFVAGSGQNVVLCGNGNGITHASNDIKTSVSVTWQAPAVAAGSIYFRATVVKDYNNFWVGLASDTVTDPDEDPNATAGTTTTTERPTLSPLDEISLDECGDTKGCFRSPENCDINDCDVVVTWTPRTDDNEDTILFELQGKDVGWVALGFSDDDEMGDDYVLMCQDDNGAQVRTRLNVDKTNRAFPNVPVNYGLSEGMGSVEDDFLRCSVRRTVEAPDDDQSDDFKNLDEKFTLFLASGSMAGDSPRQHDSIPLIADKQVRVTTDAVEVGSDAKNTLIKVHALCMISAWMFLISVSLLLARFYKPAFPGVTICKVQVWFALHRLLNILAVALTIAAFVVIFVEVEGYTEISDQDDSYLKGHPILGIIVTFLAILNPLMALCRPHPDEPRRPIFNWFHWGAGTVAHIASFVTIYFGFDMPKSRSFIDEADRGWVRYVLGAFIGWHALAYIILELHKCVRQRNKKESDIKKELEMMEPGYKATQQPAESQKQLHEQPRESFTVPYVVLGLYIPGAMAAYAAIMYGIIAEP